ncbi:unnamed protein product [Rhizophagus irregularis]|nr:unnamed protein product [Rhizophagus irregularis]
MKLFKLSRIANGLLGIHIAEKVHKDFHITNKFFRFIIISINSDDSPSVSENLISECFDVQFYESDLNEINQEEDNLNNES